MLVVDTGLCRAALVYRPALVIYGFVHLAILDGVGELLTRTASHQIDVRDDADDMDIKADSTTISLYKGDWLIESLEVPTECGMR